MSLKLTIVSPAARLSSGLTPSERQPVTRQVWWLAMDPSKLAWTAHVVVPFDWGWSKNRRWLARKGSYARRMDP